MQDLFANVESAFPVLFSGAIGWILFCVGASVLYRKSKGKPLFPKKPDQTLFFDSSVSGHSNRSLFTRLGGARNCLLVAVTKDSLIVQPKFPFNLMFLPEVYGLEHCIPRKNISSIVQKEAFMGKAVTVEFTVPDRNSQSIVLSLRRLDEFLTALGGT